MAQDKTKKYLIDNPDLMIEWDSVKNESLGLDPASITCGSHKKAWWKCNNEHEWLTAIYNRKTGYGCPYCAGRYAIKGENDLKTINPTLAKEWNSEKNHGLTPSDVTPNSDKKVWWKCNSGHEWQATIGHRNNKSGCPYCSGRYAIKGENDLQTVNPALAEEWNHEKNNEFMPTDVLPNSNKKVWWKCTQGHEWQATISSRHKGAGCPYCSGRYSVKGKTDLKTTNRTLAKEWNYDKNGDLKPENFTANSGSKVWWRCRNQHEWKATIKDRNNGRGCPYCAGKKVLIGYNDLQTINPALAKEWCYEKNGDLKPENFTANSGSKVWWKCHKGHEWLASIAHRNHGRGCPVCASERNTSFPEYLIMYYLTKNGLEAIHSYKDLGYELDIYIPSKKIAIEYDGYFWHKNKINEDLDKNYKCKKDGIKLYRIREGLLPLNDSSTDYIVLKNHKNLAKILELILGEIIGICIEIDLKRDAIAVENLRTYSEKEDSLLFLNPYVAKEWNYEKNGNLRPENFLPNSNKKVWWKCSEGHEWQTIISNRNKGGGCPYCAGQKVIKGENDLQTVNPTLAKEWNYEKNGNLTPSDIMPNSNKKVWWKCSEGHEWQATANHRNNGRGCPECAKQKRKKK